MRLHYVNHDEFITLRDDEDMLEAHTYYILPDGQVGYSPDGIGVYWYDDMTEAEDEHG